jgi:hypothetical protein
MTTSPPWLLLSQGIWKSRQFYVAGAFQNPPVGSNITTKFKHHPNGGRAMIECKTVSTNK